MDQKEMQEKMQASKTINNKVRFYSRFNGTRFHVQKGAGIETVAFLPIDGLSVLETDDPVVIREIREAIRTGGEQVLSLTPVPVKQNDAFFMREVGKKTGAASPSTSSQTLAALAALSNAG